MRFYIASSLDNAAAVRSLRDLLLGRGHVVTYDWTVHGAVFNPEASEEANRAAMRDVARAEMKGVTSADVVIVLLPGGRGTHVEMGGALAAGKRVLVIGAGEDLPRPCAFYHHPRVRHVAVERILEEVACG